jgi:hypothetical protein
MPYVNVNGYQIPVQGTLDSEVPNYAAAYQTIVDALLQNKSSVLDKKDVVIPENATLYYTASGITIADGDFKFQIETATGDIVSYVRRSAAWVEYERSNEDGVQLTQTFNRKYVSSHNAQGASDDSNRLSSDTNDNNSIGALVVSQTVTNLAPSESSAALPVIVSTQASTGTADQTSTIQGIPLVVSGDADADTIALNARPGWKTVLKINGNAAQSLSSGYSYDSSVLTDRTTAFNTPGTDVQLFTSDNDTILVGLASPFAIIELDLAIAASQNINATYRYSTGNDTWSNLVIGSDTSLGFSVISGQIRFNPPVDWDTSNLYNGSAVSAAYYVEITRTRNGLSTPPTESAIKVFEDTPSSDFVIRGDGTIGLVQVANADAVNNSLYLSTDSNGAVFKDLTGTVNPLY